MRVLSQGQLARRIAQALLAAFLWSIVLMGAGAVPASAQISTRATTAQSIAVVPFENLTTCQPETLGPQARGLVADELQTRLLLDVLPSRDVDDAMAELGLRVPLSESDLVRLATELEVGMVVTGRVTHAAVVADKGQRYASVTLSVALFDRAAAVPVNGATVTAQSPPSMEASSEDLVGKALKQAAFEAVQQMKTRPTVTAMVLWAKGNEIFTNSGTRAGVTEGMSMVAIRGGQRIAVVQITSAEATGSYGKIVSGSPLQTGDHLRAVYEVRVAEPELFAKQVRKASRRYEQVAVAAGVLLGLAAYISSADDVVLGNISTSGLRAANLANGADLGFSGMAGYYMPGAWWESEEDPDDPEAGEYVIIGTWAFYDTAATLITWEAPSGSQSRRVAAYFGFRELHPVGGAFPTRDENWIVDDWWAPPPGYIGAGLGFIALDVIQATGQLLVTRDHAFWDPDVTIDSSTGEITLNPEYNDWVESTCTGVLNGILWGDTHIELWWQVIGPYPSEMYEYKVLPITIENIAGGNATNPLWRFVQNNWSYTSPRRVVSVAPPPPYFGNPQQGQDISVTSANVSVQLYQPGGADEMIVQIARDQGPGKPIVFQPVASGIVSSLNPGLGGSGPTGKTITIPVSQLQALPGDTDVYWLRVGARNRSNPTKPLIWPVEVEYNSNDPLFYDEGWVWWEQDPMQITIPSGGAASLSAMKKDREVLTNSRTGRGARIHRPNQERELHVPR